MDRAVGRRRREQALHRLVSVGGTANGELMEVREQPDELFLRLCIDARRRRITPSSLEFYMCISESVLLHLLYRNALRRLISALQTRHPRRLALSAAPDRRRAFYPVKK